MITYPVTENNSSVITATGLVVRGGRQISAITLDGGTASSGATLILDDSTDGSGTVKWVLRAPQYGSSCISFPKPIPFVDGIYATLTGTASKAALAYT